MAKRLKVLIVFISLSLSLCLMSNTYSRYVANTTGNVEVLFAKWQILINETDITNNSESNITITPVIEANQYTASNTVAPSSTGYFDIEVDPTNVDVSFDYSINLELDDKNLPDLMITKYSIIDKNNNIGKATTLNSNVINGTMNYDNSIKDFKFETFSIRVYFEWIEGTKNSETMNDAADTKVGNDAAKGTNDSFQIKASISFEQKIN